MTKTIEKSVSKSAALQQEKEVRIKLTSAWYSDGPCLGPQTIKSSELEIPGFPKVDNALMGFHAEFAIVGGAYLFSVEKELKKDCKLATIEIAFTSPTQTNYSDILKSDPEYWKTAKVFHLAKAKRVLKKRVAELVSDYYLRVGYDEETVKEAEAGGFDLLINLDPNCLVSLFRSQDFPMLDMVIAPIYPTRNREKFEQRAPHIAVINRKIVSSIEVSDMFDHKVKI